MVRRARAVRDTQDRALCPYTAGSWFSELGYEWQGLVESRLMTGLSAEDLVQEMEHALCVAREAAEQYPIVMALAYEEYNKHDLRPCVYLIYSEDDELLYIGSTDNIIRRMKEHVSTDAKWLKEAKELLVLHEANRDVAYEKEWALIKSQQPKYNVTGKGRKNV